MSSKRPPCRGSASWTCPMPMSVRSAAGHRREEADLVGRGDRRVETGEVADVLAVDVDVDEPVELAVVGQELRPEAWMALHERPHHRADRVAIELERLRPTDVRPEHGRDEDRAHARASGETCPAIPVRVSRNGASTPSTASGRPSLRA